MDKYTPAEIKEWDISSDKGDGNGFKPARPLTPWRFFKRIKLAWLVFIGKLDALDWEGH